MAETLIQMRFIRRHQMYNAGDVAAFPLPAARQLHEMRAAEGIAEMVPILPKATPEGDPSGSLRQPTGVVRK